MQDTVGEHEVEARRAEGEAEDVHLHEARAVELEALLERAALAQRVEGQVDTEGVALHGREEVHELAGAAPNVDDPRRPGDLLVEELHVDALAGLLGEVEGSLDVFVPGEGARLVELSDTRRHFVSLHQNLGQFTALRAARAPEPRAPRV